MSLYLELLQNNGVKQNKMHWAAHGHTAAEKIYYSADADKPYMEMKLLGEIDKK